MFIQTETTPNPNALKFLPGMPLVARGSYDFRGPETAAQAPLAQRLFKLAGVVGVYIDPDFVSITKDEATPWETLKPRALAAIMDHLTAGLPAIDAALEQASAEASAARAPSDSDNPSVVAQIEEILETRIRPAVAMDGGDIVFDRFEDGIVYLEMRGACAGCPSSTATLKSGVENMLRHFIPEVQEVRAVRL